MKLSKLLERLTCELIQGTEDAEVREVCCDSRRVERGDLFVCIEGEQRDGHAFIQEAVKSGATVIAAENLRGLELPSELTVIRVENSRYALALMAAAYYGYPAEELSVIGITGTKGKTTVSCMIRDGLRLAGHRTGLIGTIGVNTEKETYCCRNTTPESIEIQRYLREMADAGCDSVVMEVSSQGLKHERTAGIPFLAGVFTNFGRDHIASGEHASEEEYLECKRRLFLQCEYGFGNLDDKRMDAMFRDTSCRKILYGTKAPTDYFASGIQMTLVDGKPGVRYDLRGKMNLELNLKMPGEFNVMNSLAAAAVLDFMKVPKELVKEALENVFVPGRMELAEGPEDCSVYVDYAHNAMSLQKSLQMLRAYQPKRLVVVFGCGGNRSEERRISMGETAGRCADLSILTTDNPRFEDPQEIVHQIEVGIKRSGGNYRIILDREAAVYDALKNRMAGDMILIAGKGHEDYQEIRGVRYPMDDRKLVKKCTRMLL